MHSNLNMVTKSACTRQKPTDDQGNYPSEENFYNKIILIRP